MAASTKRERLILGPFPIPTASPALIVTAVPFSFWLEDVVYEYTTLSSVGGATFQLVKHTADGVTLTTADNGTTVLDLLSTGGALDATVNTFRRAALIKSAGTGTSQAQAGTAMARRSFKSGDKIVWRPSATPTALAGFVLTIVVRRFRAPGDN